ncbi:MAG: aldehyde dehydrogenase family protein [Bacteroidota bacterium]|nr:aldehyde dehydrogenase family protein [Bacteroidota bacterium]MDP4236731.1 aldehyde dehydrogenase family protein [Bacteroidota bacterium]
MSLNRHPIIGSLEAEGAAGVRDVLSPHSGTNVGSVSYADSTQMEMAIAEASKVFQTFRDESPARRSRILQGTSDGIASRKEEIAQLITSESGKPITYSRIEVDRAVFTFAAAAKAALHGEDDILPDLLGAPNAVGRRVTYRYFPIGVIAAITPFNFPLNLVAHKVAPAIAAGNTVILKPAPQTPLTSFILSDIMREAGLPDGVLNVVPCENHVAEAMVTDPRIAMLSFTGSAAVGWKLKSLVPKKKVALELGGNGSAIIDEVKDWDSLITALTTAAYYYAGQVCISLQNLYVRRQYFDEMLDKIVRASKAIGAGEPTNEATILGPMISEAASLKTKSWIDEAVAAGATMHCGNYMPPNYITPTVLTNVPEDALINKEEAFAPVLLVIPYDEISEPIRKINSSRYGLQASLYSGDPKIIESVYEELEVGGLIVNDTNTFRIDTMPYGGIKDSGFGREGIEFAMREMSELKVLVNRASR